MFCSKCGAQLVKDAAYCMACGEKVEKNIVARNSDNGAEINEADTIPVKSAANIEHGSNFDAYGIGIVACIFIFVSWFLPFATVKAWGYDLVKATIYERYIAAATGAEVLVPIGLGVAFFLSFLKDRTVRIMAGVIAIICIGYPLYEYAESSRVVNATLEIGGIVYLIAGLVFIVACFIPIKANTEEK